MVIVGLAFIALTGMYAATNIDDYVPANENEAEIIALIKIFHQSRVEYDAENYLACLSESGRFMFAGSLMVSKDELRTLLPPYWEALQSGRGAASPVSRESLNGNFLEGLLLNPVISVQGNKAQASVTFATTVMRWKSMLRLSFEKEGNSWRIVHFSWDMG